MSKDLYKILGIPKNAGNQQVRNAYRTLAKRYHPDTGAGSSEEKFREIQDAYETLSDPVRKAAYDFESDRAASSRPGRAVSPEYAAFRNDPSHIDLSDVFSRSLRPETIMGQRPPGALRVVGIDPWGDLEYFLRYLRSFEDPDW